MHLAPERAEQPRVEPLVRRDDRERRVPGRRVDRDAGREALLYARDEQAAHAGRRVEVPAHDRAVAVDDRADGVHDREDRDARVADPAERGALAGGLALLERERLADGSRPARAAGTEREGAR